MRLRLILITYYTLQSTVVLYSVQYSTVLCMNFDVMIAKQAKTTVGPVLLLLLLLLYNIQVKLSTVQYKSKNTVTVQYSKVEYGTDMGRQS